MSRATDLLNLDVLKLFEQHGIEEIVEIEKQLDGEIERKRNDLRSMVGDRYKDILTASDAIKSMQEISEQIVRDIEQITITCEKLIDAPIPAETTLDLREKSAERTLLIQIRLMIYLNDAIWLSLDEGQNLIATELYLLAQHIYTGINLTSQNHIEKLLIVKHLKANLSVLSGKIFEKVTEKLESIEITAEETSQNLNALMLLENKTNEELLKIFIEHRKTALEQVIDSQYSSVRFQVAAMVQCISTTIILLHECFIYKENNYRWEQLQGIVSDQAEATIWKIDLPITPLVIYIPDIIKQFKPKLNIVKFDESFDENSIKTWLDTTKRIVERGLTSNLTLVTNIKGLYLIREEVLKVVLLENWQKICKDLNLIDNFNVWSYFFQNFITKRAEVLITMSATNSVVKITKSIDGCLKSDLSNEIDLRQYAWQEDYEDVKIHENCHLGLTMKSKGYSRNVVKLCKEFDEEFLKLLKDVWQYFYGVEYPNIADYKFKKKSTDRQHLEKYLMMECSRVSLKIPEHIHKLDIDVGKTIFCARFLQAACELCASFTQCCQFTDNFTEWQKVVDSYNELQLWQSWIDCTISTTNDLVPELGNSSCKSLMGNLMKWDEIDIQEQTENETFKSQIKVPLKPSGELLRILVKLSEDLNKILPYTLPMSIHIQFIHKNIQVVLDKYHEIATNDLNQLRALQYLLDVRYIATMCICRDSSGGDLTNLCQTICDLLRNKIDPFDLDVFYSYLQNNVRKAVAHSQIHFGSLLPSRSQLMNLGAYTKSKEQEKHPSLLALSVPGQARWFPLLPITAPSQKIQITTEIKPVKTVKKETKTNQSATSLFTFSADWFS